MPAPYEDHWRRRFASSPFRASVSFDGDDLVLGSGTVLRRLGAAASRTISLGPDAANDRMVALLAVAGQGGITKAALTQLDAALDDWRSGDRGLAAIRLAFAPLPRLRDHDGAYRLFLAEIALDTGLSPNRLLEELRYSALAPLLKFDPNQARVPAGSGPRSGQWTSGGTPGVASDPASSAGATGGPARGRPTPVFLRPEDLDGHAIGDKWRRFGLGGAEEDESDQGRALSPSPPEPAGPAAPGVGLPDLDDPAAPETSAVPVPRPTPAPGGGASPPSANPSRDEKGPACPPQQNDISRGPNTKSDLFEYIMSILVNPDNPTPKNSFLTPNVTSQAYFLPASTASGLISFDDCKQTSTPTLTSIPGLRVGDLLEYKSPWWNWILSNPNIFGYNKFADQVKNQNEAVNREGKGRQIFYCMGDQATAAVAASLYGKKYSSSHFLICH